MGQPKLNKFKAAPVSGFFLLHEDASSTPVYPDHMKYVFNMQNSTGGVNKACVEDHRPEDQWKCIFANFSYAYSTTPMFPLQSALDSWQMGNIWLGDKACTKNNFKTCTAEQTSDLNGYASDLLKDYQQTAKYNRNGEGGFIE